jgi:hypothetical protein
VSSFFLFHNNWVLVCYLYNFTAVTIPFIFGNLIILSYVFIACSCISVLIKSFCSIVFLFNVCYICLLFSYSVSDLLGPSNYMLCSRVSFRLVAFVFYFGLETHQAHSDYVRESGSFSKACTPPK